MNLLIEFVKSCGGYQKAAAKLGEKNYQTVQSWVRNKRVTPSKVVNVHIITGIPLEQLNPDLYGNHINQLKTQPHAN